MNITPSNSKVHILSNGQYTLQIADSGASRSICLSKDVTRAGDDVLRRPNGIFAIIHSDNRAVSITKVLNFNDKETKHSAIFRENFAEFKAENNEILSEMVARVHPNLPCEMREVKIFNKAKSSKDFTLTFYLEPILSTLKDFSAHKAFSKLFIRAKYLPEHNILLFTRRRRTDESPAWLSVGLSDENENFEYDFNRENVLQSPLGVKSLLCKLRPLLKKPGVPDPCCALRVQKKIGAKSFVDFSLLLAVAATEDEAVAKLIKARKSTKNLSIGKAPQSPLISKDYDVRLAQKIASALYFNKTDCLRKSENAAKNNSAIETLWSAGISGDNSIVTIDVSAAPCTLAFSVLSLFAKLRMAGIIFDLCFMYSEGGEYSQDISKFLENTIAEKKLQDLVGINGGIHFVDTKKCCENVATLILACSSLILNSSYNLNSSNSEITTEDFIEIEPVSPQKFNLQGVAVEGGIFTKIDDEDAFCITKTPPLPWCQVLANENFGTLISHQSLGYTFAQNSRENKLTPWYNDTQTDNKGEMLIAKIGGRYYDLTHGAKCIFTKNSAIYKAVIEDVLITIIVKIHANSSKKIVSVELCGDKNLELCYYTEPALGVNRAHSHLIKCEKIEQGLILQNPLNTAATGFMTLSCNHKITKFTNDRLEFFKGNWSSYKSTCMRDMCAAVTTSVELVAGENKQIIFELGFVKSRDEVGESSNGCAKSEENIIKICTKNPLLDAFVNTWLPSQIQQSRIFGRTAFYQAGGAFGFRDQLQDCLALMQWNPLYARNHILKACSKQFEKGDVLHWWHPLDSGDTGVRTKGSDDMLFLPYVLAEYVEMSGDLAVLDEQVPYLEGDELPTEIHEKYFKPCVSNVNASVYEHALAAISTIKLGENGLPLIGAFDWNDGFSNVGVKGRGESVWLALFASVVCEKMAKIAKIKGDDGKAAELEEFAATLKFNVDENAWDGDWYLRAFFDDGTPMGSVNNRECKIDILPQAFSVIANLPDNERIESALESVFTHLVDEESGIIKLFTLPFDEHYNPGYIKGYPPGVRENGGQYTHAAVWFIIALFIRGRANGAYNLLKMIAPYEKYRIEKTAEIYKTEPYAICADVYSTPEAVGRGGWSLYTGAASWYYKAIVNSMLGINLRENRLDIAPNLPDEINEFTAKLRFKSTNINLNVQKGAKPQITVNGVKCNEIILRGEDLEIEVIV